jgi:arylsulfatase A-like enzyme
MSFKPNVLFLLLDGIRSDKFLGAKKSSLTPNLDFLIKKGTYFSQAVASAPSTTPSVASIFTSLYPHQALVKDNNLYRINSKNKNFPSIFKENGYFTYSTTQDAIKFLEFEKFFDNSDSYSNFSFLWNGLAEKIVKRLNDNFMKEPWLYYLHLYDLHLLSFTYEERKKFAPIEFENKKFGINQYEQILSAMDRCLGKIIKKIDLKKTIIVTTADHGTEAGVYDDDLQKINDENIMRRKHKQGSIFKISHKAALMLPEFLLPLRKNFANIYNKKILKNTRKKMDKVIDEIENQNISTYRRRLLKQSAWMTSDIEPLLYDDRFRIPLLFTGWNIPEGKLIKEQVRSIDIFPTLADMIQIPYDNPIYGKSLIQFIKNKGNDIPALLEDAVNSPKFVTTEFIGIRVPEYKYFRLKNDSNSKKFLYDLIHDPNEENNISNENKFLVLKMEKILTDLIRGQNFDYEEINESSDEESILVESELRKLGYL